MHLVAKDLLIVGVIEKEKLDKLFEVYKYWHLIVTRLNRSIHSKARSIFDQHLKTLGLENFYLNQLSVIENVRLLYLSCFLSILHSVMKEHMKR